MSEPRRMSDAELLREALTKLLYETDGTADHILEVAALYGIDIVLAAARTAASGEGTHNPPQRMSMAELQLWRDMDAEWRRLRRIEAAARAVIETTADRSPDGHGLWQVAPGHGQEFVVTVSVLRAALAALSSPETTPAGVLEATADRTWPRSDDLRTTHTESTRLPLGLSASGEASVPTIVVGPVEDAGTTTDCPLEGVHEHPFRGPHRFHEWDPANFAPGTPTPAGVLDEAWAATEKALPEGWRISSLEQFGRESWQASAEPCPGCGGPFGEGETPAAALLALAAALGRSGSGGGRG